MVKKLRRVIRKHLLVYTFQNKKTKERISIRAHWPDEAKTILQNPEKWKCIATKFPGASMDNEKMNLTVTYYKDETGKKFSSNVGLFGIKHIVGYVDPNKLDLNF